MATSYQHLRGGSFRNSSCLSSTIAGGSTSFKRPSRDRCFLVIGKTGNGKSSVGNTILGERKFQVKAGMAPMAELPLTEQVVSTPIFKELKVVVVLDIINQIHDEYQRRKHVQMAKAYDPDAVLLAIKCDARYTREEFELYRKVREYWPEVTQRLVVAFTFGENCGDIESELKESSPELQEVLRDASGRYCVFGKRQQLVDKSKHRLELHDIVDRMKPVRGAGGTSSFPWDDMASSSSHSTTHAATPNRSVSVEPSTRAGFNSSQSSSSCDSSTHAATTSSLAVPMEISTETNFNSSQSSRHAATDISYSSPSQPSAIHTDVSSTGSSSRTAATAPTPDAPYTPDWTTGMTPVDVRRKAKPFRILIIGKTGSGMSTTGNILLGMRSIFGTRTILTKTKTVAATSMETTLKVGFKVKVVDTPDLYSRGILPDERQRETHWWKTVLNGDLPDTFLLCVPAKQRVSGEEIALCNQIAIDLGFEASDVRSRLTIAFTFADESPNLERDLLHPYEELQTLLEWAGKRYIVLKDPEFQTFRELEKQKEHVLDRLFRFHEIKSVDQAPTVSGPLVPVTAAGALVPYTQTTGAAAVVSYGQSALGTDRSILIVGKTGNGKSTVGNMILRRAAYPSGTYAKFDVATGMRTVTTFTAKEQLVVNGRDRWTVVDTPDISNLVTIFSGRIEQRREVDSWRDMSKPGPDVILLVVRCDVQYTYEERRVYENIKELWSHGPSDFTSRLVVAFTFPAEKHIETTLKTASIYLGSVLRDARNRIVVFAEGKEEESVKELLHVIEDMKKDRYNYRYSVTRL